MSDPTTQMLREVQEIPEAVEKLSSAGMRGISEITAAALATDPNLLVTVARGSSDHVCTYLKYACELVLGRPLASVGPSVASIYEADLRLSRSLALACFVASDAAEATVVDVADALSAKGATVFDTSTQTTQAQVLPHLRPGHCLTDPLALIVSFYVMIEGVARARGINPDAPRHLNKVTETV